MKVKPHNGVNAIPIENIEVLKGGNKVIKVAEKRV